MRILKYAILALITREAMTGYDITKEFNSNDLSNFWYAKHSQIYPELRKLVKEGLLTYKIVIQGEKMEKKLYSITDKGHRDLLEWLTQDEPLEPSPKDVFRLRTYFSDLMTPEELNTHLISQLEKRTVRKNNLQYIMDSYYESIPNILTKEFGDYMVLKGAIMREDSYIEWLNHCILCITDK